MGLCQAYSCAQPKPDALGEHEACADDVEELPEDGRGSARLTKRMQTVVKPLACDLEAVFDEFCNEEGKLDVRQLTEVWKMCAERKHGALQGSDADIIQKSAALFMATLDFNHTGFISYDEFALFMLGACEERGQLKDMRTKLHQAMSECPTKLSKVIQGFRALDVDGSGYVRKERLTDHMQELAELLGGDASTGADAAAELFEEADVLDEGKLDLWEVVAHSLGRKKAPVELLLYDLSAGVMQRFSKFLLGQQFEAIYHSSVLVFGKEYWFGGKVFRSTAPCRNTFGEPVSSSELFDLSPSANVEGLHTVHLGYTLATKDEWDKYVTRTLCKSYSPGSYDIVTCNCNRFSNECVMFLTGGHIPNAIVNQPELMMHTRTAKLLRPFLNKWLGGFGEGTQHDDCHFDEKEADCEDLKNQLTLGAGRIVIVEGACTGFDDVVAAITNVVDDETCEVRFFDPEFCGFVTKLVNRSNLKRTKNDELRKSQKMQTWGIQRMTSEQLVREFGIEEETIESFSKDGTVEEAKDEAAEEKKDEAAEEKKDEAAEEKKEAPPKAETKAIAKPPAKAMAKPPAKAPPKAETKAPPKAETKATAKPPAKAQAKQPAKEEAPSRPGSNSPRRKVK